MIYFVEYLNFCYRTNMNTILNIKITLIMFTKILFCVKLADLKMKTIRCYKIKKKKSVNIFFDTKRYYFTKKKKSKKKYLS